MPNILSFFFFQRVLSNCVEICMFRWHCKTNWTGSRSSKRNANQPSPVSQQRRLIGLNQLRNSHLLFLQLQLPSPLLLLSNFRTIQIDFNTLITFEKPLMELRSSVLLACYSRFEPFQFFVSCLDELSPCLLIPNGL